jgi:hypothetical protein
VEKEIYESGLDLRAKFEEYGWETVANYLRANEIDEAEFREEQVLAARAASQSGDPEEIKLAAIWASGFIQGFHLRDTRANGEE